MTCSGYQELPRMASCGQSPFDLAKVCEDHGAVFAVWWTFENGVLSVADHYNPSSRIEEVRNKYGTSNLYSLESYRYRMRPGEGLVGKAFARQKAAFFLDLKEVDENLFLRKKVAEQFGIKSIALAPFQDGVLEMGSSDMWTSFTEFTLHELARSRSHLPGHLQASCDTQDDSDGLEEFPTPPSLASRNLEAIDLAKVCEEYGAVFAVWWAFDKGVLSVADHYNPQSRVEEVRRQTGKDDLYTTESYKYRMRPGEGSVGEVFASQQSAFYLDITELDESLYLRKKVAERFGIRSVSFAPFKDGVLEIGSTDLWTTFTEFTLDELRLARSRQ
eukprot:TRINITY_DN65590_c0_g1_i1.p1 TRINITY_DN65590_c0_g1~~TRINITY_DN65590_c0_g1_i1.p1  ORF type:complete len:346 (-),score=57.28 TRINITY_DN65590_c0_g1_i1:84-1076(-)